MAQHGIAGAWFYLGILIFCSLWVFKKCSFTYFWERQRESMCTYNWGRGRERGRERIPSWLCTVSTEPNMGLQLTNHEIMTWAQIKSQMLNWLNHPGTPYHGFSMLTLIWKAIALRYCLISELFGVPSHAHTRPVRPGRCPTVPSPGMLHHLSSLNTILFKLSNLTVPLLPAGVLANTARSRNLSKVAQLAGSKTRVQIRFCMTPEFLPTALCCVESVVGRRTWKTGGCPGDS